MPHVLVYKEAISPRIIRQEDGKYSLLNIPIFECHDREDIHCDEKWMYACVKDQEEKKKGGFLPRLIVGHNSDQPAAQEKPAAAFLDNYRYDPSDQWLYADYVDVSEELLEQIKANKWPGRSVEASRDRPAIDAVALLGGTPPYFKLPDVKYAGDGKNNFSIFTECHMATQTEAQKKEAQMRATYREFLKTYNMPVSGDDAAMEADYKRFCAMYERLQKELSEKRPIENGGEQDAKPKDDGQYGGGDDTVKPEEEKKMDADYAAMSGAQKKAMWSKVDAAGGSRDKNGEYTNMDGEWADRSPKLKYSDTPEYKQMLSRLDQLEADKHKLVEENERAKWKMKYQELPIPSGRIDVDAEVDTIMDFPESKRELYFKKTTDFISTPAVEPIKYDDTAIANARPGTEAEAIAIRQLYSENRDKYRGDYAAAQRDYRSGTRASGKK